MNKTISKQLRNIIIVMYLIVFIIIVTSNYFLTFRQTLDAAGIEAYGCANITTGLIDPDTLISFIDGDPTKLDSLNESIDWAVDHKQIFHNQYIISLEGELLAVDKHIAKQGFDVGDQFVLDETIVEEIITTKQPSYSNIYTFGGYDRITGYAPIFKEHDPNNEVIALNAIDFEASIVTERTMNSVVGTSIIGFISLTIAGFITILLVRNKTRPISEIIEHAKTIADGDLSKESLQINTRDEVGQLATAMNSMQQNLKNIIGNLTEASTTTNNYSDDLKQSASDVKQGSEQISVTMNEIAGGTETQSNSINDLAKTMDLFTTKVEHINKSGKKVQEYSGSVLAMTEQGARLINESTEQTKTIDRVFQDAVENMNRLNESSQTIGQLISVILDISEQTNLLALNASIEAARAGEHGKGFSIVANEVRILAEEVANSVTDITDIVNNIRDESISTSESLQAGYNEVSHGISQIEQTGETFGEISKSVTSMIANIRTMTENMSEILVRSNDMNHTIQEIASISEQTVAAIEQTTASTQETNYAMEDVASSATNLATLADELNSLVHQFKL